MYTPTGPSQLSDADYLDELRRIKDDLQSVPGLSITHIFPSDIPATLRIAGGGSQVRLHRARIAPPGKTIGMVRIPPEALKESDKIWVLCPDGWMWVTHARGKILNYSRPSRLRLLQRMSSTDRRDYKVLPGLVTLTYPGEFSPDGRRWKRDLKVLGQRFEKRWGACPIFWKLEFQKRGAPHFHLLVYDPHERVWSDGFRAWLARAWYEIVGSGDERHLSAGTRAERPRGKEKAELYATKYAGKPEIGVAGVGRYWGIWHPELLPTEIIEVVLDMPEYYRCARVLRRLLRDRGANGRCKSVFMSHVDALRMALCACMGP